jgi:type III secretion protein J
MSETLVHTPLSHERTPLSFAKKLSGKLFLFLSLFLVALLATSCESTKTIVNGLDEREANEILVFLSSKNIQAQKLPSKVGQGAGGASKEQLWDIAVSPKQADQAMAILNSAGLPRRRSQSLLNIFSAGGLVPSEMQEKIRYQAGLADQIASTIRKIDGVLDADVQLSFPEEDPLNPTAQKGKVTASVYVKHNGVLDDPNAHLVTKIKRLVASSVPNLDFDDVTIIGDKARFSAVGSFAQTGESEKVDYVKVWSLIIAKESLTTFQIVFASMCGIILFLGLMLSLAMWKLYPIVKKRGGIKVLFHLHAIPDDYKAGESDEKKDEKTADEDKTPKDGPQPPKVQENVES